MSDRSYTVGSLPPGVGSSSFQTPRHGSSASTLSGASTPATPASASFSTSTPLQRLRSKFGTLRKDKSKTDQSLTQESRVGNLNRTFDDANTLDPDNVWVIPNADTPNDPRLIVLRDRLSVLRRQLDDKEDRLAELTEKEEQVVSRLAASEISIFSERRASVVSTRAAKKDDPDLTFGFPEDPNKDASMEAGAEDEEEGDANSEDEEQPSVSREKRIVRLVRKEPTSPLGFTLSTVLLPKIDAKTGKSTHETYEPTFIGNVVLGGIAFGAGLRVGDQILEVDGEPCAQAKHSHVVKLIQRNHGTLTLTVRYTDDYQRACLHKRKIALKMSVDQKLKRYHELTLQEEEIQTRLERGSAPSPTPSEDSIEPSAQSSPEKVEEQPVRAKRAWEDLIPRTEAVDLATCSIQAIKTKYGGNMELIISALQRQCLEDRQAASAREAELAQRLAEVDAKRAQLQRIQDKLMIAARRNSSGKKLLDSPSQKVSESSVIPEEVSLTLNLTDGAPTESTSDPTEVFGPAPTIKPDPEDDDNSYV